ncbi:MAG TPA: hypothetical protein PK341_15815 [Spirochaetota bacterium]|nr:hypothetical protein [Spirochaetota bacterium]
MKKTTVVFSLLFFCFVSLTTAAGGKKASDYLDESFGNGGIVLIEHGIRIDEINGLSVLPDGGIVVSSTISDNGKKVIALFKYAKDGSIDSSFGSNGVSKIIDEKNNTAALAIAVQADGKIIIAGKSFESLRSSPFIRDSTGILARCNSDGSLDKTFGAKGVAKSLFEKRTTIAPNTVMIQPDGMILIAGSIYTNNQNGIPEGKTSGIARYKYDGSLDKDFGSNGYVLADLEYEYNLSGNSGKNRLRFTLQSAALQPDGKIVLAGNTNTPLHLKLIPVLARFDSSGKPDKTFGSGGVFVYDKPPIKFVNYTQGDKDYFPYDVMITALLVDKSGKITAPCYFLNKDYQAGVNYKECPYLANRSWAGAMRIQSNGEVDTTYGKSGIVTVGPESFEAKTASMLADGMIIIAGRSEVATKDFSGNVFSLARCSGNGYPDASFAPGGFMQTGIYAKIKNSTGYVTGYVNLIAQQKDGKILAAGPIFSSSSSGFAIVRYKAR